MRIYVGNLANTATENDLREAFQAFGQVASAQIMVDRYSGQPRGFAFVEMANNTEALAAINGLSGKDLKGRVITVNEARPRREGGAGDRGGPGGGGRDSRRF